MVADALFSFQGDTHADVLQVVTSLLRVVVKVVIGMDRSQSVAVSVNALFWCFRVVFKMQRGLTSLGSLEKYWCRCFKNLILNLKWRVAKLLMNHSTSSGILLRQANSVYKDWLMVVLLLHQRHIQILNVLSKQCMAFACQTR